MEGGYPGASAAGPGRYSGALTGFRLHMQLPVAGARCPVNKAVEVGDPTIGESGGHAMEWRDAPWRRRHRESKG